MLAEIPQVFGRGCSLITTTAAAKIIMQDEKLNALVAWLQSIEQKVDGKITTKLQERTEYQQKLDELIKKKNDEAAGFVSVFDTAAARMPSRKSQRRKTLVAKEETSAVSHARPRCRLSDFSRARWICWSVTAFYAFVWIVYHVTWPGSPKFARELGVACGDFNEEDCSCEPDWLVARGVGVNETCSQFPLFLTFIADKKHYFDDSATVFHDFITVLEFLITGLF